MSLLNKNCNTKFIMFVSKWLYTGLQSDITKLLKVHYFQCWTTNTIAYWFSPFKDNWLITLTKQSNCIGCNKLDTPNYVSIYGHGTIDIRTWFGYFSHIFSSLI